VTDIADKIMAYESGEMPWDDALVFFQYLVDTGTIWSLQGNYQRTAQGMIESGWISDPS
jgi:hypothetical protein